MYLDPGFGSMVIQIVIASLAGISIFFFTLPGKVRSLFSKKKQEDVANNMVNEKTGAE